MFYSAALQEDAKKVSVVPFTLYRELTDDKWTHKNLVHDFQQKIICKCRYAMSCASLHPILSFSVLPSSYTTLPCYNRGRMGGWLGTTSQELFPFPPTGDAI